VKLRHENLLNRSFCNGGNLPVVTPQGKEQAVDILSATRKFLWIACAQPQGQ
jgi:hypothetical protein